MFQFSQFQLPIPVQDILKAPGIRFFGGGSDGAGAAATSFTGDGTLGVVTFTNHGGGFTTNPTVTISGPTGVGTTATAIAEINNAGIVTFFGFTNAGSGYTTSDVVNITFRTFSNVHRNVCIQRNHNRSDKWCHSKS